MANKITYQIGFTADTTQLKTAVNEAVSALNKLGTNNIGLDKNLRGAANAALDLSINLQKAFNQETGKLDLITFQNQLKKSGMSLEQYALKLNSLGTVGQAAFLKTAQAITAAELPLKRTNAAMDKLWTTMKNTLRWQLTSSALNTFIGALQTAYGYTQDLNKSLNNIRIVSGKSVEEMDRFAEKANKAAKALSASTLDYTQGALIYAQQGLDDEQIEARTEITLKMAQVSRQSAEEVSDQMTAIWNNFYDGSKSLEYYADVITALGAKTASSSDEIATGLEKFAAIGETVGLSYEYATAGLATITATTRQSAEIVGTALKTVFSRMQGLQLGETLDDGTTLNKYSQALQTVGINILEQNGELKEMDRILDEMGAKWKVLSNAQQTALAQTIGGKLKLVLP